MITEQGPGFEALLEHLTCYRGIDFSGYKQPSLIRRVVSRMRVAGVGDCVDYLAYLDGHPEEYTTLFDSILINVTGFFRDETAWAYVRETLLPQLLSLKPAEEPVRVWSAGCASGEEVYTLAMLFAEAVGPETFCSRVKIYATDVDEEALTQARQGAYTDRDLESVPAELRPRYFETAGSQHVSCGPPGVSEHAHVFRPRGPREDFGSLSYGPRGRRLSLPREGRTHPRTHPCLSPGESQVPHLPED
jgi:two-component system CheB/CheR fusion protein